MIKYALFTLATLALTSSALADTKSASTQASLSLLTECTISATDMDLGVYNARTGASGTAHAKVSCNTQDATVFVDGNDSILGTDIPNFGIICTRTLRGVSNTIPYYFEIALPTYRSIISPTNQFGNTRFGATASFGGASWSDSLVLHNADFLLTGTVAPGFWKPAGQYTDLVTITLTYNPT